MFHLLVVEDTEDLARLVEREFREEGFEVTLAFSGEQALKELRRPFDLVILDLNLPDISGESILDHLTQASARPPVLVLTARSHLDDKLSLFRRGCDDYLTKPFELKELVERVRALLRRPTFQTSGEIVYQDLRLDHSAHKLSTKESSVTLTPKESAICKILLQQPEKVISRSQLLQTVWGIKSEPGTNFLGVHLINLRKKFAELDREKWLVTVRAAGLMIRAGGMGRES